MIKEIVCLVALCGACSPLLAHDLWLKAEPSRADSGGKVLLYQMLGEEITSAKPQPFNPERSAALAVYTAKGRHDLLASAKAGASPLAEAELSDEGGALAELLIRPRLITLGPSVFNRYLSHEGLGSILSLRARRGEMAKPGRERYSRFNKALVCGERGSPYEQLLGHKLEIIPERDPCASSPGDRLPIKVLYEGKPLAGALVSAGFVGFKPKGYAFSGRTDKEGRAEVPLSSEGLWVVRLVHMIESPDKQEAEWESFWATLSFMVNRSQESGDSRKAVRRQV